MKTSCKFKVLKVNLRYTHLQEYTSTKDLKIDFELAKKKKVEI